MADAAFAQAGPLWRQQEDELRIALQRSDEGRVRALLDAGANVDARDALGGTALHVAVHFRGDRDIGRLLVSRGADVNARNDAGYTPLLLGLRHAQYRHSDPQRFVAVAELLLASGASPAIAAKDGMLPVRAAMEPANMALIRLLPERGGATLPEDSLDPLHWAIALSSGLPATPAERAVGRALLPLRIRHGADPDMRMCDGSTERTYARYARQLRIGDSLEDALRRHAPRGSSRGRQPSSTW